MTRILIAASLALVSCTTVPNAPTTSTIAASVERANAAYQRVRPYAEKLSPYSERIRLAMALIERGLLAARVATTVAEQAAGLASAEAAMRDLVAVTATPAPR